MDTRRRLNKTGVGVWFGLVEVHKVADVVVDAAALEHVVLQNHVLMLLSLLARRSTLCLFGRRTTETATMLLG